MAYQGLWNLEYNKHLPALPAATPTPTGNGQPLIPGGPSTPSGFTMPTSGVASPYNPTGGGVYVDAGGVPRFGEQTPFNPAAGQWGDYGSPTDANQGHWGWNEKTRRFEINGRVFAAGGLSPDDKGALDWVARHKPMWDAQRAGTFTPPPSTGTGDIGFPGTTPPAPSYGPGSPAPQNGPGVQPSPSLGNPIGRPDRTNPFNPQSRGTEQRKDFGPLPPYQTPTNPIFRKPGQDPFNTAPSPYPGNNPLTRNSNFYRNNPITNDWTTKGGLANPITTKPGEIDKPTGNRIYETGPDGRTPGAEQEYTRILNDRNPWGTTEQYFRRNNNAWMSDPNADLSKLPERIRNTASWNQQTNQWDLTITDSQGRHVQPIGDQSQAVGGERSSGSVIDWNQVWYDPELGMVTTPGNLREPIPNRGSRAFRRFTEAFIASGFIYAIGGAAGMWGTPSGATLTEGALEGAGQASASIGTEAAGNMVANLPTGTVSSLTQTAAGAWQAIVNGATYVWNNARGIWQAISAGLTINNLAGNPLGINRNDGNRSRGVNNNDGGGFDLNDIISRGIGAYQDNRDFRDIVSRQNDLLSQGDYNREYRPGYLADLSRYMRDPSAMFQDPDYLAMEDAELGNLSRKFNARGMALSGNEMGGLATHQRTMRTNFRNQELGNIRNAITLGNPEQMYSSALRNLPLLAQMRANRNTNTQGLVNSLLRNAPEAVSNFVNRLISGSNNIDWSQGVPEEVQAYFRENPQLQQLLLPLIPDGVLDELDLGDYTLPIPEGGDDEDFWAWFFGEDGGIEG